MQRRFAAIIQREGKWFVALCPELDVASQGETIEEARGNLAEAIQLYLEVASPQELAERDLGEIFVTQIEVPVA